MATLGTAIALLAWYGIARVIAAGYREQREHERMTEWERARAALRRR